MTGCVSGWCSTEVSDGEEFVVALSTVSFQSESKCGSERQEVIFEVISEESCFFLVIFNGFTLI